MYECIDTMQYDKGFECTRVKLIDANRYEYVCRVVYTNVATAVVGMTSVSTVVRTQPLPTYR